MIDASDTSVQTILTKLANVDINTVGLDTRGIDVLAEFAPATTSSAAKIQYQEILKGFDRSFPTAGFDEVFRFSKQVKAEEGGVYAVRSIAYRVAGVDAARDGLDIISVFKIVNIDDKGVATVIARQLSRQYSPALVIDTPSEKEEAQPDGTK
jgi:hypothetical protein